MRPAQGEKGAVPYESFFKGLAGALSTVGAYLVYLLGGWDAALTVMFVLMGLDYATGLLTAFMGKSPKTQGGGREGAPGRKILFQRA